MCYSGRVCCRRCWLLSMNHAGANWLCGSLLSTGGITRSQGRLVTGCSSVYGYDYISCYLFQANVNRRVHQSTSVISCPWRVFGFEHKHSSPARTFRVPTPHRSQSPAPCSTGWIRYFRQCQHFVRIRHITRLQGCPLVAIKKLLSQTFTKDQQIFSYCFW